ncbi:MAG: four helix bundle protein [Patescibacteria group bacterium]
MSTFHKQLKNKTHQFIMLVYDLTESFPKSELYGTVSQLRRAAVSVMLNYVEGFARIKLKVKLNSYETSYGSIRECKYLLFLACERKWIIKEEYIKVFAITDEISAMLWSLIDGLEKEIKLDEA